MSSLLKAFLRKKALGKKKKKLRDFGEKKRRNLGKKLRKPREEIKNYHKEKMNNDIDISQLERQLQEQAIFTQQLKQQLAMLESVAKQKMGKEAISRYGNLKMAHPETAVKAIALIAQAVSAGQVKEKITDEEFKMLLQAIQQGKKEFKFRK